MQKARFDFWGLLTSAVVLLYLGAPPSPSTFADWTYRQAGGNGYEYIYICVCMIRQEVLADVSHELFMSSNLDMTGRLRDHSSGAVPHGMFSGDAMVHRGQSCTGLSCKLSKSLPASHPTAHVQCCAAFKVGLFDLLTTKSAEVLQCLSMLVVFFLGDVVLLSRSKGNVCHGPSFTSHMRCG